MSTINKPKIGLGLKVEVPLSEDVDLMIKLPKELIAEIFSHCVMETIDLGALELVDPPWNLAQICSLWRTVALSSPNLWNDIAVQFLYHRRGEFVHLMNLLEIFLSRAGNSSISLNIAAAVVEYPLDPKLVDSMINLVHPHIGQFRHLGLQPVGAMMPILQLPSDTVQALESASLVFDTDDGDNIFDRGERDGWTEAAEIHKIIIFDTARNLRYVTLTTEYAEVYLNVLRFPWSQLTHLTLLNTFLEFQSAHEVLRQCTSLVSCNFGINTDWNCWPLDSPTILHNLVSLTVYAFDPCCHHGEFLQPFILPSLRYLELCSEHTTPWTDGKTIALIRRSLHANFECFRFTSLLPHEVLAALSEAPLLKELSLSFPLSTFGEEPLVLVALITAVARGDVVPNIETFNLKFQGATWNHDLRKHSIKVQCRPEEMQQGFRDFWIKLRNQDLEFVDVILEVDGEVWINGS
ncbi:hypothetical protein L208DRAFT_1410910 [Tricholoma matsutake]|nr:hypothetical protein L208DRAFT_1410910 [Tricholoma matsutake 945]